MLPTQAGTYDLISQVFAARFSTLWDLKGVARLRRFILFLLKFEIGAIKENIHTANQANQDPLVKFKAQVAHSIWEHQVPRRRCDLDCNSS